MAKNKLEKKSVSGHLNPRLRQMRKPRTRPSLSHFAEAIRNGDRKFLAQAITYMESTLPEDQSFSQQLLDLLSTSNTQSRRIGISGSPGVGKSTFIEAFGLFLIEQGKKVAVLAIDPSSQVTHGSILGDKTRMESLARNKNAFVRPSPAGEVLGGVARATRETISLCEAAGYEYILIETVGVGQSEITVASMTDMMMLLLLPGAGDDLQGIKRGIVEMADILVVNKAEEDRLTMAKHTKRAYANALHLFPEKENAWSPPVFTASALQKQGLDSIWKQVNRFFIQNESSGWLESKRSRQASYWYEEAVKTQLLQHFRRVSANAQFGEELLNKVKSQETSPFSAANEMVNWYLTQIKSSK